jgi:hypothetical protein
VRVTLVAIRKQRITYASMDPSAAFCRISRSSTRIVPASDSWTHSR